MTLTNCQNPLCNSSLKNNSENNSAKIYHCTTCNKDYCAHCCNTRIEGSGNYKTCIYCGEKLAETKSTEEIPDENNIALAVEKRFAMGEHGQKMQKAYCLKCFKEIVVDNLLELPNKTCLHCGTSFFVDAAGKRYQSNNNTFQPTVEYQVEYFKDFIEEYKTYKSKSETNPLTGTIELNNWLYQNINAIDLFKLVDALKEKTPKDAEIFQEAINQFKNK